MDVSHTTKERAAIETVDDLWTLKACASSGKTQVIAQRLIETLMRMRRETHHWRSVISQSPPTADLLEIRTE